MLTMEKKKSKVAAKQQPTTETREIPFNRAVRIRNFKMWRTRVNVGNKKTVEAIVISDLDGTWKVQIPETYLMFRALSDLYSTEDKQDFDILFSFLTNFNFCTSISHGCFQNFLILAVYGYKHPEVLDEGYEPEDKKFLSYDEFFSRVRQTIADYKKFLAESENEEQKESGQN